jgi:hypothetical protein
MWRKWDNPPYGEHNTNLEIWVSSLRKAGSMDTSRSSTATRNPCRMAHTAEQFVNVHRTPRSDVGEGELVEAERLERAGAAEERGWAWSTREHSWATASWSTRRSWSRQAARVLWRRRGRGGRTGRGGAWRRHSLERRIRLPYRGLKASRPLIRVLVINDNRYGLTILFEL